jgi:hypothetical protein
MNETSAVPVFPRFSARYNFVILSAASLWLCLSAVAYAQSPNTAPDRKQPAKPASQPVLDWHTTALWLFDDAPYANVTLTDAGPYHIDLRLETGFKKPLPKTMQDGTRGLVPGKFGRALHLPVGDGAGVTWPTNSWIQYGRALMSERGDEVPERCNLGYLDFTLEFWFKASGPQSDSAVIWEVRNEGPERPGVQYCPQGYNALLLESGRKRFLLASKTEFVRKYSLELPIPTDSTLLNDGSWHHLAFTFTAAERQMHHFVDGRLQPLPDKGSFLPLMGELISMRVGRDKDGLHELEGLLDEMRLSDVVRYRDNFAPPGSFSRNFGPKPPAAAVANGPRPLFEASQPGTPINLGSRKHVFIDDTLIETQSGVTLTVNPPAKHDITDFRNDKAWEPGPRQGAAIPDMAGIWDDGDRLGMLYSNNAMFGGKSPAVCVAFSRDGVHWTKPELGIHTWDRFPSTNIVLRIALQGQAIRDPNPAALPGERYKLMAWCMNRGFYVFTSPDAIHWTRNETIALPFDPDGSIGWFWDDQRGIYRGYFRALLPPSNFRAVVRTETFDIFKSWPFKPVVRPDWHVFAMPKPTSGEFPFVDAGGEVYRFYAAKYPGAPDVFLALPWRYIREGNIRPGSFLMTSRDGINWRRFEPPYYFEPGWQVEGRAVLEALTEPGLIVRGDEVWQYGTVRFTEHGGALYGGVEHEGSYFDRLVRLVQRLDGFVSLDAKATTGIAVTRPLIFSGTRLTLNAASKGRVRVALLDASGKEIPGYALDESDPIQADSVRQTVTWKKRSSVAPLAGKPVRIRFELTDAKLYALQFN